MVKMLTSSFSLAFMASCLFPCVVFSQIQITAADVLALKGNSETSLQEQNASTLVDVGSAGADQTWDFRGKAIEDSIFALSTFIDPSEAEDSELFPTANLVERISTIPDSGFTLFSYYNVGSSYFIDLGEVQVVSTTQFDTTLIYFNQDTVAVFPFEYGDTWTTFTNDTTDNFGVTNISIDTTVYTVDAWGTVILPVGSFECLRLREDDKSIDKTVVGGFEISSFSQSYIRYNWVAKGVLNVAWVQSQDGETNPNFTDAQGFSRLDALDGTVSVRHLASVPETFSLEQNYPNPFNPETRIRFNLDEGAEVDLAIFNPLGQKVRTLIDGDYEAGPHEATWNGRDDSGRLLSAGLYFYRLTSGDQVVTKKMVFVQ